MRKTEFNDIKIDGNQLLVSISGEFKGAAGDFELRKRVVKHIERGCNKIIIDALKMKWVNSAGLGIIVSILALVRKNEGNLVMVVTDDRIKEVLHTTQLHMLLSTFDDVEAAKRYLD